MKFIRVASCILSCSGVIFLMEGFASAALLPVNLCCESKASPVGLSEPSPRLSWQEVDTIPGERGQFQTACEIQVASSLQLLTNNQPDLWDTGEMPANQTSQIAYAGSAL
ncbi:MAG TPA: alpha-L-rhamnosidase, partial [Verrucomicrobiae bacterium]|nr:alpha-L-rhamnosidase [Verrucomicrobiae bacterium]